MIGTGLYIFCRKNTVLLSAFHKTVYAIQHSVDRSFKSSIFLHKGRYLGYKITFHKLKPNYRPSEGVCPCPNRIQAFSL